MQQSQQLEQPSPQETKLTSELANDRPTIDTAVKSFVSLVSARSLTASDTDATTTSVLLGIVNNSQSGSDVLASSTQQQILQLARIILKAVNSFQFSLQDTVAATMAEKPNFPDEKKQQLVELGVTARLWNGLVQSEQKPSRFLGRRALKLAWPKMNMSSKLPQEAEVDEVAVAIRERQLQWLQEFETLLLRDAPILPANSQEEDDDSALLWSPDKGAAELAKRRQRRQKAAEERGPSTPS
jgi:hypothetical protein